MSQAQGCMADDCVVASRELEGDASSDYENTSGWMSGMCTDVWAEGGVAGSEKKPVAATKQTRHRQPVRDRGTEIRVYPLM